MPEHHRAAHRAGLEHFLLTGEGKILGRRLEIEALRRDGKEIKVELSVTALKRRDGIVFNGFFRDLTDKIAAEDRIRHAEKMEAVGQLTGGIAHDFNNILTVITGTIEILAEAVADKPQLAAITKMIDEAASRGAELTQHLLAFARKQPLQPRETDINTLIIDTAKLLRPTLGEQIEIESVFEDDVCVATVDPNQLTTAMLNLALNARDAMPNGGKLILETGNVVLDESYARQQRGRPARPLRADRGERHRRPAFPPTCSTRCSTRSSPRRAPARAPASASAWSTASSSSRPATSRSTARKATARRSRCICRRARGAAVAVEAAVAGRSQGGHETILVVEDDKLVRDYVLTQLHSLGYVTLDAANAAEALALVDSRQRSSTCCSPT